MYADSSLSSDLAHRAHIAQTESVNVSALLPEVNLLLEQQMNVHTLSTHVHFLQGVKVCAAALFPQWPERAGGHSPSDLRVLLGLQKGSLKLTSLKIITVFEIS